MKPNIFISNRTILWLIFGKIDFCDIQGYQFFVTEFEKNQTELKQSFLKKCDIKHLKSFIGYRENSFAINLF